MEDWMLGVLALGHVGCGRDVWACVAARMWSDALVLLAGVLWQGEHRGLVWSSSLWAQRWQSHAWLRQVQAWQVDRKCATSDHLLCCLHGLPVAPTVLIDIRICLFQEDLLIDDSLHMWHVRPRPLLHYLVLVTSLEVHLCHAGHARPHKWSLLELHHRLLWLLLILRVDVVLRWLWSQSSI